MSKDVYILRNWKTEELIAVLRAIGKLPPHHQPEITGPLLSELYVRIFNND